PGLGRKAGQSTPTLRVAERPPLRIGFPNRLRHPLDEHPKALFALAQGVVEALARRDILEKDSDSARRGQTEAKRVHIEPAAERERFALEADRLAARRHLAVGLEP